jgi:hypothetical protein
MLGWISSTNFEASTRASHACQTIGVRGGGAPIRGYLPELLEDVLAERINPGRVIDYETDLNGIGDAYADERAPRSSRCCGSEPSD